MSVLTYCQEQQHVIQVKTCRGKFGNMSVQVIWATSIIGNGTPYVAIWRLLAELRSVADNAGTIYSVRQNN